MCTDDLLTLMNVYYSHLGGVYGFTESSSTWQLLRTEIYDT